MFSFTSLELYTSWRYGAASSKQSGEGLFGLISSVNICFSSSKVQF